MKLYEKVKIERHKKRVTQQELAEALGMSERTYRKYEKGEIDYTFRQLFRISDYLGIDIMVFLINELIKYNIIRKCNGSFPKNREPNFKSKVKNYNVDIDAVKFILSII